MLGLGLWSDTAGLRAEAVRESVPSIHTIPQAQVSILGPMGLSQDQSDWEVESSMGSWCAQIFFLGFGFGQHSFSLCDCFIVLYPLRQRLFLFPVNSSIIVLSHKHKIITAHFCACASVLRLKCIGQELKLTKSRHVTAIIQPAAALLFCRG